MTNQLRMQYLLGFNSPVDKPVQTIKEKKSRPKRNWRLDKKAKAAIGIVLIAAILVSCYTFYPRQPIITNPGDELPVSSTDPSIEPTNGPTSTATSQPQATTVDKPTQKPKTIDYASQIVTNSNGNLTREDWKKIAAYAWKYFETNVDPNTGLPGTNDDFAAFTDWDLGVYLQAIIDANKIGLIGESGAWGSTARIEKVLTFLETRELNETTHYPYWFYKVDGSNYHENSDKSTVEVDIADTGRLFVALNNLKDFNPDLATRIDDFVYGTYATNRSDYAKLVPGIRAEGMNSKSIYAYYTFSGFASFWPSASDLGNIPDKILNNILSANKFSYGNVTLPESDLVSEPIYCALFEQKNPSPALYTLAEKVYNAHETYYNISGHYRAFSEGPIGNKWGYELTVKGDDLWVVTIDGQASDTSPVIYTKTAFGFLALYNRTFAINMCMYLESSLDAPTLGYYSGINEDGIISSTMGPSLHTNGLIISAAQYAYQHIS